MPVSGPPPHTTDSLKNHLRNASRFGKIILSNQQVALLCDPWRVAKPGTDHV
ncbi:MAG: hypothetical protein ACKOAH_24940 [Pirellula sp.]